MKKEKQLRELVEQEKPVNVIAAIIKKSTQAVKLKMRRLNLKEVGCGIRNPSSCLRIPSDLPSVEEALHVLCGALDDLGQLGLDQSEVLRLRTIIQGVKTYRSFSLTT